MRTRRWIVGETSLVRFVTQTGLAASLLTVVGVALAMHSVVSEGERIDERGVLLVLVAAVLLYGPLRSWWTGVARRVVTGRRESAYDVVAGLAGRLDAAPDASSQVAAAAETVAAALGVDHVALEVRHASGPRVAATLGREPPDVEVLPIRYRGVEVGQLRLPTRRQRGRVSARDEALLGDLVRQTVLAARARRLAEDLQHQRERMVTAREEVRRRLRRDLHDGLGPTLSGAVFQLETARLTAPRDAEGARRILDDVARHLDSVSADVRRLIDDLRPAALDDLGLVEAIRQQVQVLEIPALRIDVSADAALCGADPGPRLPAATEVAAYRIVAEGLTNVVRHADAASAQVHLGLTQEHLVVEVLDDGAGMPAEVRAGVGLMSIRERAAELGGRSEVTCAPDGGTRLRAWLPLDPVGSVQSVPEERDDPAGDPVPARPRTLHEEHS